MSNDYFEFKQMRIEQANCAMKVSTDACIQGAWTPIPANCRKVLDIGTGTGLLSLMLAQRNSELHIDALEIDTLAAIQASENVSHSPFNTQISVLEYDAKKWQSETLYDLIICNPPFFSKSLKGNNSQRNVARHNDHFSFEDLVTVLSTNLQDSGIASILLPCTEWARWEELVRKSSLNINECLFIKPFEHMSANRVIVLLSKMNIDRGAGELVIYARPKQYTSAFIDLLHPFYLHL